MNDGPFRRLRIAIVGGCQVAGLSATAKRLLPGAEVAAWHVGVHPKCSDEELLASLAGFDTVISQLSDWDGHVPLRITRLREQGLPVVYLPVMVFPGFHPDITYISGSGGLVRGPMVDYHSIIVAAAFTLGLPESRVAALFNALIFTELGYFEVFDAAKAALFANFKQEGIDLSPLFDFWMQQVGQFMYTVNHPHILVMSTLCRHALAQAGRLEPGASLPDDIDDSLAQHFRWPAYPALARRIGVPGSSTFLRGLHGLASGQTRELPLTEYISVCFRFYEGLGREALQVSNIVAASERLGAFVLP
jgi:Polysaccharide biosynthesis enzyme WcbI